jgi:hypothetical protein
MPNIIRFSGSSNRPSAVPETADIAYAGRTDHRPQYYANDHSRDTVVIKLQAMSLVDGRREPPSLDAEGFVLVDHPVDAGSVAYRKEVAALVKAQTGADAVVISAPGVKRFSERSPNSKTGNNAMPARFAHVDISDATAAMFSSRSAPDGKAYRRAAHYNIWRVLSVPPQDVPLAVCDARSWVADDLILADAIFDEPGKPEWSFEGLVVAHNPAHRWLWFPDMTLDEALIFKTHDSAAHAPHCVPHVAFDNPACPANAPPRASIEIRAIAYWY